MSKERNKLMTKYRQGDVPLIPIKDIPPSFQPTKPENGKLVLALGEATGHHHRIEGVGFSFDDPESHRLYRCAQTGAQILEVGGAGATLLHEEHTAIPLPPGRYLQLIQVEDDSEMIAAVAD